MARWLSWLERRPVTAEVVGSSPIRVACTASAYAGMAELADAQDLKSCGTNLPYRFDSGCRQEEKLRILTEDENSELFVYLYKVKWKWHNKSKCAGRRDDDK